MGKAGIKDSSIMYWYLRVIFCVGESQVWLVLIIMFNRKYTKLSFLPGYYS